MGNKNSGRRPLPTALKVLRGNPGLRPVNEAEPIPPAGEVEVPVTMSAPGRVVWARLAPIAIAMRTLTTADVEAFKTLCELQATLDMAARVKDEPGFVPLTVSEDAAGAVKVTIHGAARLELQIAPVIRPYYEKFGLEPVGRARIRIGGGAPASKWAGLA